MSNVESARGPMTHPLSPISQITQHRTLLQMFQGNAHGKKRWALLKTTATCAVYFLGGWGIYAALGTGWSGVDCVYFAMQTVLTVGSGDVSPESDSAKLFSILFAIFGIVMVGKALGEIMAWFMLKQEQLAQKAAAKMLAEAEKMSASASQASEQLTRTALGAARTMSNQVAPLVSAHKLSASAAHARDQLEHTASQAKVAVVRTATQAKGHLEGARTVASSLRLQDITGWSPSPGNRSILVAVPGQSTRLPEPTKQTVASRL